MFCRNCGKEVAQNAEICLSCGVRPSNGANFCNNCGVATNPNQELCVKCGVRLSGASGISSADEDKIMCVLSYLWALCLIPYFTKKNNAFVMFHARQGLVLFIAWIIIKVVGIFLWRIAIIGWTLMSLLHMGILILSIIGIIQALQGNKWKMPVLGDFAEKL